MEDQSWKHQTCLPFARFAQARKNSLETRIAAQVDDVDIGIVEAVEKLAKARWALEQTTVRAPANGEITALSLRVGDRVSPAGGAMSFASASDRAFVASLPQSSRNNVSIGDEIRIALRTMPGQEISVPISAIPFGSAEGEFAPRTGLPSIRELSGGARYLVTMEIPDDLPASSLQLGTSGTGLVITEEAGAIAALANVLFWIGKMMNYL